MVGDVYKVRNYIAHGDRIPDHYMMDTARGGFGESVSVYAMLFEAQSAIIRTSLLRILGDNLLKHFVDADASEAYFEAQGLTKNKLLNRKP